MTFSPLNRLSALSPKAPTSKIASIAHIAVWMLFTTSVVLAPLCIAPSANAGIAFSAAGPVRRIKFAPGATEATATGRLRGQHDVQNFVLRVRAGQHMHVAVESDHLLNPQIDVVFPSGEHQDRDMQGTQFDTDSTQAGDYRIKVYEGMKAAPSNGVFVLKVTVN